MNSDNSVINQNLANNLIEELIPLVNNFLSNFKKFLIVNFIVALLTAAYLVFFVSNYYQSNIVVLPEYGSKSTSLSSLYNLASIAGVKIGESNPLQIYNNILRSEIIIEKIAYRKYQTTEFKDSVNLITYFEIEPDEDYPETLRQRLQFLSFYKFFTEDNLTTEYDNTTGILNVKVAMPESKLSSDVVNSLGVYLDEYLRTKSKSYAKEQRFYIEKRIKEVADSLIIVENQLKKFREQNRIVRSPELILEQGRLTRSFEIVQAVYTELVKQLEFARIDEIKDAPVLNIREYSKDPVKKAGPIRTVWFVVIMFISGIFTAIYFMFINQLKKYFTLLKTKFFPNTIKTTS